MDLIIVSSPAQVDLGDGNDQPHLTMKNHIDLNSNYDVWIPHEDVGWIES